MNKDYLSRLSTHCPLPELYRRDDFLMLTDEQMAVIGERQRESDAYRVKQQQKLERRRQYQRTQIKEDFKDAGRFLAWIALWIGVYIGLPAVVALCIAWARQVHGNTSDLTGTVHHDAHARVVDGRTSDASADADPGLPGERAKT